MKGKHPIDYSDPKTRFLWADGQFVTTEFPGAIATFPYDVNEAGAIFGFYTDSEGTYHGFIAYP